MTTILLGQTSNHGGSAITLFKCIQEHVKDESYSYILLLGVGMRASKGKLTVSFAAGDYSGQAKLILRVNGVRRVLEVDEFGHVLRVVEETVEGTENVGANDCPR